MATRAGEHFDVVIVGAGLQGLVAANTFLTIQPSLKLRIFDDHSGIGGVWRKEQIYPSLRMNNLQGYFEHTNFPILDAGVGVEPRGHLEGEAINAYVLKYAEQFDLTRRVQLNTRVVKAIENDNDPVHSWTVELSNTASVEKVETTRATCTKLIVATGFANRPFTPHLSGIDTFHGPIFHSEKLAREGIKLSKDSSIKQVTVLGGSKSAHDAAYLFAKAGKHVTMFLRQSGKGGVPMVKIRTQVGPWNLWLEGLLMTRAISWFGVCPWGDADGFSWIRWFLHQTSIGRAIVRGYFNSMTQASLQESGILEDERSKKLLPDASLYWYGIQPNILNYDTDFYSLIRDGSIDVIRDEIDHVEGNELHFKSGDTCVTDAIVFATGYKFDPAFPLEPHSKNLEWGIPVAPSEDDKFPEMDSQADVELLSRYPELASAPPQISRYPSVTPWRLWRFIAPLSQVCAGTGQRNLAFLNAAVTLQAFTKAELSSLWTYAYLHDKLTVRPTSERDVAYEATLWSRFGWWARRMGLQGKMADCFHDSMPYYDLLLRDLGVKNWRKGGLFSEIFGRRYAVEDYSGIVQEWLAAQEDDTESVKKDQ